MSRYPIPEISLETVLDIRYFLNIPIKNHMNCNQVGVVAMQSVLLLKIID